MEQDMRLRTIGPVAAMLGVDRWRLAYLIDRGDIPDASVKVPGRRLFTPQDIEQVKAALAARERHGREGSDHSTQ